MGLSVDLTVSFDYHIPDNVAEGRVGLAIEVEQRERHYLYEAFVNEKGTGHATRILRLPLGMFWWVVIQNKTLDSEKNRVTDAYITNIKIELGNNATPWTPAPEDQALGTTPGKFLGTLVWDKPYPSPKIEDYIWSEIEPKSIVSVKRMFGVSQDAATEPAAYAETAPQITGINKYLWAYDIVTYTDNTTTETTHAIVGVYGDTGKEGKDAISVRLSSEYIIIDTDSNGAITPEQLLNAYTEVMAFRGTTPIPVVILPAQTTTSPGISISVQRERIQVSAVATDPETGYAYASGWIEVGVRADGVNFGLRIFIGTNVHRKLAQWVHDNENFRSEFTTLKNDYQGNKQEWNSRIQQNAQAITQKVEQTVYQADNAETSRKMAKLKTQADRISAKLSETKEKRYNLLRNTKTLRGNNIIRQGITLQERAINDFSVVTANTTTAELDVLKWKDLQLKANTYYALSFYAKGEGTYGARFTDDVCAEVSNSQGLRSTASNGYNTFTLTPEWVFCWAVFKTKPNINGKTDIVPLRLTANATVNIYAPCLIESAAPVGWTPYQHDPQKNLVKKPLGIDGRNVTVAEETVVENEKFGKVRRITNNSYWFQLQWDIEDLSDSTEEQFTLFIVARETAENTQWRFGAWLNGDKGCFDYLTQDSAYIDLGDGWRKYYTTFFGRDKLHGEGEIFGINGLHGTLEIYAVGLVQGDECPTWHAQPMEKALLDTGIDITRGYIRQVADHFEWVDNEGETLAVFKDGKGFFSGHMSAKTFSTPNDTFHVDEQGNITAINMEAVGGTFSNVIIKGSFSSPYATVGAHYNISLHDNAWLDGENTQWNHFNLQWDVSQRGRTLHITNYPLRGAYTGYGVIIAPQGKYFFDQGRRFSKIAIYTGTSVVLHGIGSEDTFYGWLVEQRNLIGNYMAGVPFRVLAWGFATCNPTETTINAQTYNGYALAIERIGQGHCRILLPVPWTQALLKYGPQLHKTIGVSLTGFGHSYDDSTQSMPVKATIKSIGMIGPRIAIDIWLSDDDRVHDGAFQFIIYNMAFNNMFQTSENI